MRGTGLLRRQGAKGRDCPHQTESRLLAQAISWIPVARSGYLIAVEHRAFASEYDLALHSATRPRTLEIVDSLARSTSRTGYDMHALPVSSAVWFG